MAYWDPSPVVRAGGNPGTLDGRNTPNTMTRCLGPRRDRGLAALAGIRLATAFGADEPSASRHFCQGDSMSPEKDSSDEHAIHSRNQRHVTSTGEEGSMRYSRSHVSADGTTKPLLIALAVVVLLTGPARAQATKDDRSIAHRRHYAYGVPHPRSRSTCFRWPRLPSRTLQQKPFRPLSRRRFRHSSSRSVACELSIRKDHTASHRPRRSQAGLGHVRTHRKRQGPRPSYRGLETTKALAGLLHTDNASRPGIHRHHRERDERICRLLRRGPPLLS